MPPQTITQGQSFTDTQGNQGVAQFNPNTGQALSSGQSVGVTPVINASTLAPNAPVTYPQMTGPTPASTAANAALGAHLGTFQANNQPATTPTDTTQSPEDAYRSNIMNTIFGDTAQLANQGTDATALANNAAVATDTQAQTDATNKYNATAQSYADRIAAVTASNPTGMSADAQQQQVDELGRQRDAQLADIAIQKSAADGDLTTAQNTATAYIAAKYQPLKDQITSLTSLYNLTQNDMTDSEKMQAQANITAQQDSVNAQQAQEADAYKQQILEASPLYKAQTAEATRAANAPYAGTTLTPTEQNAATQKSQTEAVDGAINDFTSQMQTKNWAGADPGAYSYYKNALVKEYGASAGTELDAAMKTAGVTVSPVAPAASKGFFSYFGL
jgi:hypothetical protein